MIGRMQVKVLGLDKFVSSLTNVKNSITPEMLSTMEDAAKETQSIMRDNIPTRTGSLAASVDYEIEDQGSTLVASIGPNDNDFGGRAVGGSVELGLGPGQAFPPAQEIADRYGLALGVGFLVARAIYEKGSGGVFYGEKTLNIVQPVFAERGISALLRIAGRF